jgi:hypothetical protein
VRSAISDAAVRPVVIALLDPTSDRGPRFLQASILGGPDFLFLQAAVEPFNVLAAGAKSGYTFLYAPVKGGDGLYDTYTSSGTPSTVGTTGQRQFCSSQRR